MKPRTCTPNISHSSICISLSMALQIPIRVSGPTSSVSLWGGSSSTASYSILTTGFPKQLNGSMRYNCGLHQDYLGWRVNAEILSRKNNSLFSMSKDHTQKFENWFRGTSVSFRLKIRETCRRFTKSQAQFVIVDERWQRQWKSQLIPSITSGKKTLEITNNRTGITVILTPYTPLISAEPNGELNEPPPIEENSSIIDLTVNPESILSDGPELDSHIDSFGILFNLQRLDLYRLIYSRAQKRKLRMTRLNQKRWITNLRELFSVTSECSKVW